jgi:uncharacterized protein (TIGR02646 family)
VIFVERPDAPEAFKRALNKRGLITRMTELEAAMWFYAGVEPDPLDPLHVKPAEAPNYQVYKHDTVKDVLHNTFNGHCAYCESRYEHVVKMDVEHYRPKGAVVEADGTKTAPGYYWLAASWENLLPSCNLCNRANTQELTYPDGSTIKETKGKANFFPLLAGTVRAAKKGDELHEDPLLLNPCNPDHDPAMHLLFRSDGLVEPRKSTEEQAKPRGMATIETCALHRSTLVEVRRADATLLRDAMAGILRAEGRCRRYPTDEIAREELIEEEAELTALIPRLNFRAMTRELTALFNTVRDGANSYCAAEQVWRAHKTQANVDILVAQASELSKIYELAGLHQSFVAELLKIARVPLGALVD